MKVRGGLDAREASLLALSSVEEDGAFVNLALADILAKYPMDGRDKRLAAEITYGVVTYRLTLDWLISQCAGRPAEKLDRPVLHALRIGFYQLFYLDRIPAPAAVHTTVDLVKKGKKRGLAPFVNGVMRGALRRKDQLPWPDRTKDEVKYLSLTHAHPEWLVSRWLRRLGTEETEKLLAANNQAPPLTVRVNTLRITREKLIDSLAGEGVDASPSGLLPEGVTLRNAGRLTDLDTYRSGLFQVQGESAMLTSRVLAPQPGETVLDGCSAPGGKTTHLAQLMENRGKILALDIHEHRLELVLANCRRLGVEIVQTQCLDARLVKSGVTGLFDSILLDVPCSGFGVIRRKPDLKWRRSEEDIAALAALQKEMLKAALDVLKPGGSLVYSTCTNEPEETDEVITQILSGQPGIAVEDVNPYLPPPWQGSAGTPGIHLYPHLHGVDGFFISKLKKA